MASLVGDTITLIGWSIHAVTFRLYSPLKPWFDKTWKSGEFEEAN